MIKINIDNNLTTAFDKLRAGDRVLLSGTVFTARDAAHKKILEMLNNNENLPFDINNSIIYYAGPTETPIGGIIGSLGPTTSARMDAYANLMKRLNVKAVIGKGERSLTTKKQFSADRIVYFIATGGCGALLSSCVKSCEIVGFSELGCESVKKLTVCDFPVTVAYDLFEGDIFNG